MPARSRVLGGRVRSEGGVEAATTQRRGRGGRKLWRGVEGRSCGERRGGSSGARATALQRGEGEVAAQEEGERGRWRGAEERETEVGWVA
jgi:hypothetical protein